MSVTVFVSDATRHWAHNLNDLRQRWSIRKEEPTETEWMPVEEFSKSLETITVDDLIAIRQRVLEISHKMKSEIGVVKARAAKNKEYLPIGKYKEMLAAEMSARRHLLCLADELQKRRMKKSLIIQSEFMNAARDALPEELFKAITKEAHRRIDEDKMLFSSGRNKAKRQ